MNRGDHAPGRMAPPAATEPAARGNAELLAEYIRHSPIYTYIKAVTPTESRVLYASENFSEMIGIAGSAMVGKTMAELFPPDFAAKITADDWAVVANGKVLELDEELNGRYYTTIKFPILQGAETLLAGYTIDLTERKRTEEALREREVQLQVILDTTADGILAVDARGNVILANQRFAHLWGIPPSVLARKKGDVLVNYVRSQVTDPDAFVARVKELYTMTCETVDILTFRDGRIVERHCAPLLMGKALVGRVLSFRDITERRRAEKELQTMQKLQSVGTLAGGIAHDFNNILMGLFGNLSLAKDEIPTDHPARAFLEEAEQSMHRAVRLTKQLLTFAKGGEPVKEDVSLGTLVEEVARFDLSGSNVRLVCRQAADLWPAEVDKGQIQQVISNLTINARQAMPQGGQLHITLDNAELDEGAIFGLKHGRYVRITVIDEGPGIDPKQIDRIFDPYFTTKQTGSGLGLTTAYSIISKHGGHIGVTSELGKGTTFTIHLPASSAPRRTETQLSTAEHPRPDRPVRILVMDDEEDVRKIVVRMLSRYGFSVATATDGQTAVEMYRHAMETGDPFDAIIMDLTIPGGMGGKDAIQSILALDPKARAVVSSGYATDPVMANYADFGFKGIVAKPYTPTRLLEVLGHVLK